jgi:hypothetical protein
MDTAPSVMGKWMAATWRWDAFVTLTFRDPPPTPENAARGYTRIGARGGEKALLGWLHESVVRRAPGACWWFVEEHHRYRSSPHFHGLLGGVSGARREELWHDWFIAWGMGRIEPVEDSEAVATYCAKYIHKGAGRMWTSRGLRASARGVQDSPLGWSGAGKGTQHDPTPQVERHEG